VKELHEYRVGEQRLAAEEAAVMQAQWGLESDEAKRVEQLRADVIKKAHHELTRTPEP
jgi:hypothetical protein